MLPSFQFCCFIAWHVTQQFYIFAGGGGAHDDDDDDDDAAAAADDDDDDDASRSKKYNPISQAATEATFPGADDSLTATWGFGVATRGRCLEQLGWMLAAFLVGK